MTRQEAWKEYIRRMRRVNLHMDHGNDEAYVSYIAREAEDALIQWMDLKEQEAKNEGQ